MASKKGSTRVLVIEADPSRAAQIRDILHNCAETDGGDPNYDIANVSHLDAALEWLPYHPADVVLVELVTPEKVGTAGIKLLHETYPALPIIALLADTEETFLAEVRIAGAVDYLRHNCRDREIWVRALRYAAEQGRVRQQLREAELELQRKSLTDPLTGLLNRRGIEQGLLQELHHCRSDGSELLILLVDLDNFARINASLDYGVGDMVLQNAADRICSIVTEPHSVGRAGDDQFLVLLPRRSVEEGMILAERIRLAITRDRIQVSGRSLMMTASVGLTSVPLDTLAISEALARAHVALHRSKNLGKNRVCCSLPSPDGKSLPQPVMVSGDMLQSLLCEGALRVASQPIVCLTDGALVSREMLIRGPKGALQQPAELFRYCFEKDILTPVDLHCLKKCVAAARSQNCGMRVHVNVMPSTLLETPTDELIGLLIAQEGEGPFCLEICEQQLISNPSHLVPAVRALQEADIQIAMDDVGFGRSCLEGLLMLRPEVLKIDKNLIIGLSDDRSLRLALKRLLRVTEVLDTEVIAEGIETAEDLSVLQDFGVQYGQGFFFGAPEFVPVEEAVCSQAVSTVSDPQSEPPY